jgi:hypothetical protein
MKQKPPLADIYRALRAYDAVLVHFSTEGKGREMQKFVGDRQGEERKAAIDRNIARFYPGDLKYAIANTGQSVCCSTIRPDDLSFRNAMGSIGLMVRLQTPQSLRTVANIDDGYLGDDDDRDMDITFDLCVETINDRPQGHNEWLVKNYEVIGIFGLLPMGYYDPHRDNIISREFSQIESDFPEMPVFGFADGKIYRFRGDGSGDGDLVQHTDLYR